MLQYVPVGKIQIIIQLHADDGRIESGAQCSM